MCTASQVHASLRFCQGTVDPPPRATRDLGVEPVTIYRQLPNKEDNLAGVAEKLWCMMAPPGEAPPHADGIPARAGSSPPAAADRREQVRDMWLALHWLNGLKQAHPNAIPIVAGGGSLSASAGEGTIDMLSVFRDAGLSPQEAAELLHIPSAYVVGFGFATLWGRQVAASQDAATASGKPASAPPDLGDLNEYAAAIAHCDPAQITGTVDIVLDAHGPPTA